MRPRKVITFLILVAHVCCMFIIYTKISRRVEKKISYNTRSLSEYIFSTNIKQLILNLDLFPGDVDLVIVVQVHNRPRYLQELVNSLHAAPSINNTLLIFSHDVVDPIINGVVQNISFAKVMQIFYPLSIQTHPDAFPGPEPNRNASRAQIKHHWWWKANFVFGKVKILRDYNGLVLFLEEDHYLAPDFIHCLKMMDQFRQYSCGKCWFLALGMHGRLDFGMSNQVTIQNSVENLGLAFNRTIWLEILKFSEIFCKYDDYNWDWSLRHVARVSKLKPLSLIMTAARAFHFGICGAHASQNDCDPSGAISWYKTLQANLFPDTLYGFDSDVFVPFGKNGGWGDSRDHALCIGMSV